MKPRKTKTIKSVNKALEGVKGVSDLLYLITPNALKMVREGLGLTIDDVNNLLNMSDEDWTDYEKFKFKRKNNVKEAFLISVYKRGEYEKILNDARKFFNIDVIKIKGRELKDIRVKANMSSVEAYLLLDEYSLANNPISPIGMRKLEALGEEYTKLSKINFEGFIIKSYMVATKSITYKNLLKLACKHAIKASESVSHLRNGGEVGLIDKSMKYWWLPAPFKPLNRSRVPFNKKTNEEIKDKKERLNLVFTGEKDSKQFFNPTYLKITRKKLGLSSDTIDNLLGFPNKKSDGGIIFLAKWRSIEKHKRLASFNEVQVEVFFLKNFCNKEYSELLKKAVSYFKIKLLRVIGDDIKAIRTKVGLTTVEALELIYSPRRGKVTRSDGVQVYETPGEGETKLEMVLLENYIIKCFVVSTKSNSYRSLMKKAFNISTKLKDRPLGDFGERLKWVLEQKGLNQAQLGNICGTTRQNVNKWLKKEDASFLSKINRKSFAIAIRESEEDLLHFLNTGEGVERLTIEPRA